MAKFVMGMNVSLDGYVDHDRFAPGEAMFRHWIEQVQKTSDTLYGRVVYGLMRYWEEDKPEWTDDHREFAAAWRKQKKWVVSRTLSEVGPNATLISDDVEATLRDLKTRLSGTVDVSGTILAKGLAEMGLMDEYRLYLHPVVLGNGKPFFAGPRPRLHLVGHDLIADEVVRLTYAVA